MMLYELNRHGNCLASIQSEFPTINKQFPTALLSPLQTPSPPFRTAPSLRPVAAQNASWLVAKVGAGSNRPRHHPADLVKGASCLISTCVGFFEDRSSNLTGHSLETLKSTHSRNCAQASKMALVSNPWSRLKESARGLKKDLKPDISGENSTHQRWQTWKLLRCPKQLSWHLHFHPPEAAEKPSPHECASTQPTRFLQSCDTCVD